MQDWIHASAAKAPTVIAEIFANRIPLKVDALFAAAERAGRRNHIPIKTVDEALDGVDLDKRLVIKGELCRRGAIAL